MVANILQVHPLDRARDRVRFLHSVGELTFTTTYWYETVDFCQLEKRFGTTVLDRLCFHMVAMEATKFTSLGITTIDWGVYQHFVTPAFRHLWRTLVQNIWGEWRFRNDLPAHQAPDFPAAGEDGGAISTPGGDVDTLYFFGGGKDSLVGARLLERNAIPYDSLTYVSSCYGTRAQQEGVIEPLLDRLQPRQRRRFWITDDFLDSPVLELRPELGSRSITAAETPSSLFAALPLVLQHGYRHLALAHERSADRGQLIWDATGEEVNHQWGKSLEAESLMAGYIQDALIANVDCLSLLKPIHDVVIFGLVRRDVDLAVLTHSCNIKKPWCRRCPKCLYVWVNMAAWLPLETVDAMFGGENLLDVDENVELFAQLMGARDRLPFECIGEAMETQLAFTLCRRKGLIGKAIDLFLREIGDVDIEAVLDRYVLYDRGSERFPAPIADRLRADLMGGVEEVAAYLRGLRADPAIDVTRVA